MNPMIQMNDVFDSVVAFLTGVSAYTAENQAFWMAVQGSMTIRQQQQQQQQGKQWHWFHAFTMSVMAGFGGGWLGFIWMGKPTSMLYNDLNFASCIIAFVLVHYTPWDMGYKLLDTLPFRVVTVSFAQLFRCTGIIRFVNVCFQEFKDKPSDYYPIPVFGPILYATLLGNMSGIFMKGFEGHVSNGVPWPVQNGLVCATFYHFFSNDTQGPIGNWLRQYLFPESVRMGLDASTFAACLVSIFMQVMGFLQMPDFLGPTFSPFQVITIPGASPKMSSSKKDNHTSVARRAAKSKMKKQ